MRRIKTRKKEFFWRTCRPTIIGSSGTCHAFPVSEGSEGAVDASPLRNATILRCIKPWTCDRQSNQIKGRPGVHVALLPWFTTGTLTFDRSNIAPQPLTWTTWPSHPTSDGWRHRLASRINGSDPTKLNNIPTICCNEGAESPTRPSLFLPT